MNTKIKNSILAGVIGTIIMTIVMMLAPTIGLPKMSAPEMLTTMLGTPVFVGWFLHFMIGIIFAFFYTYVCVYKFKTSNLYLKGAIFGIIVFVFAQIMMSIMGALMPMPKMEGSMILTVIVSLVGHIVYGIAVAKTVSTSY